MSLRGERAAALAAVDAAAFIMVIMGEETWAVCGGGSETWLSVCLWSVSYCSKQNRLSITTDHTYACGACNGNVVCKYASFLHISMSGGVIFWQDGHIAWTGIHQGAGDVSPSLL